MSEREIRELYARVEALEIREAVRDQTTGLLIGTLRSISTTIKYVLGALEKLAEGASSPPPKSPAPEKDKPS